ncbi:MAG: hypothetical protein R2734_07685 [Nocardioides sp.]
MAANCDAEIIHVSGDLTGAAPGGGADDLARYLDASSTLAATRSEVAGSRAQPGGGGLPPPMPALLQRRLQHDLAAFRDMSVADGMNAAAWEFRQDDLSAEFARALWAMLLRDDDASAVLMRFVRNLPLGGKRKPIRALDTHLRERYPMFAGWPRAGPGGQRDPAVHP